MPKIVQADIYNTAVSFSRYQNLVFGTALELQQNTSATNYAVGFSSGMTQTAPLFIHENLSNTSAGWFDEGSWVATGVSLTTVIPWPTISGTSVVSSTTTATVVDGDLIGIFGPGIWSIGPNINISRAIAIGSGSQNAALMVCGETATNPTNQTELFNGSIWIIGNNASVTRDFAIGNAGTQNAGIVAGGQNGSSGFLASTELFNGAIWAFSGNLGATVIQSAFFGSQNSTVLAGGQYFSGTQNQTELFNGTTWNFSNNLLNSIASPGGAGSQNAGIVAGGQTNSATAQTELFNGSTWVFTANLNSTISSLGACGTSNATLVSGGVPTGATALNTSQLFNGTTWYFSGNLSISRNSACGAGSQNAGLAFGGDNTAGTVLNSTELHNQTTYAKVTSVNIREAKNIGVAFNAGTVASNIVYNGYIGNLPGTNALLNNIAITAGSAPGTFNILAKAQANATTAVGTCYVAIPNADDMVIGYNISLTQMYVYGNSLNSYEHIIRW